MSETARPKTEFRQNIVYATHDGVSLLGDLYLPAGPGPFPALVAVHVAGAAACTARSSKRLAAD